jgi:GGDEF domain-containing protein
LSHRYARFFCLLSLAASWTGYGCYTEAPTCSHQSNYQELEYHAEPNVRWYSSMLPEQVIAMCSLCIEQLHIGIRYFDLRVCRTTDPATAPKSPFTFTHGLLGGSVRHDLEEINEFLNKHPTEIVLLDFNHFYDFNEQCGHEQLIELVHDVFGRRICTTAKTILECTLNYLWGNRQQVILLYEYNRDQCSAFMDRAGHFFQVRIDRTQLAGKEFPRNRFINRPGRIHRASIIYSISWTKRFPLPGQSLVSTFYRAKPRQIVLPYKITHSARWKHKQERRIDG